VIELLPAEFPFQTFSIFGFTFGFPERMCNILTSCLPSSRHPSFLPVVSVIYGLLVDSAAAEQILPQSGEWWWSDAEEGGRGHG
jgi:hypothetical protein